MSRNISNAGLSFLCEQSGLQIGDVACFCDVHRESVRKYLNGRPSPRLEVRMAELFGVTVNQLRKKLGTDKYNFPRAASSTNTTRRAEPCSARTAPGLAASSLQAGRRGSKSAIAINKSHPFASLALAQFEQQQQQRSSTHDRATRTNPRGKNDH